MQSLERFIVDYVAKIPGVASIKSSFALKQVKYKTALPLAMQPSGAQERAIAGGNDSMTMHASSAWPGAAAVGAALCALFLNAPASAGVVEEIVQLPITVQDIAGETHRHSLTVTVFRDDGRASAPFMVISHGRSGSAERRARVARARFADHSHYFVSRGFAVFVPTRVGYGVTGGPDVEYSGPCSDRQFAPAFEAGAVQVMAVIRHAKDQPYVDPRRGLLVGQSVGGAITLALSAKEIEGVAGAINFAGGAGGSPRRRPDDPCSQERLHRVFAGYGASAKIPTLWLYSENDRYWGKDHPQAWFRAFRSKGGAAEFVQLPPYRSDGHASFVGNADAWRPAVEKFLATLGL